jgi:hypothetical protein
MSLRSARRVARRTTLCVLHHQIHSRAGGVIALCWPSETFLGFASTLLLVLKEFWHLCEREAFCWRATAKGRRIVSIVSRNRIRIKEVQQRARAHFSCLTKFNFHIELCQVVAVLATKAPSSSARERTVCLIQISGAWLLRDPL